MGETPHTRRDVIARPAHALWTKDGAKVAMSGDIKNLAVLAVGKIGGYCSVLYSLSWECFYQSGRNWRGAGAAWHRPVYAFSERSSMRGPHRQHRKLKSIEEGSIIFYKEL